jgi:hypothetical protein
MSVLLNMEEGKGRESTRIMWSVEMEMERVLGSRQSDIYKVEGTSSDLVRGEAKKEKKEENGMKDNPILLWL